MMESSEKTSEIRFANGFFKVYFKECLAGMLYFAAYWPTLIWMWDRWFARSSYYSHGILVPFFTLFLIWQNREELKDLKRSESVWGLRLVCLGMLIHLISSILRVYFTSGYSMMIVLIGLILHFYGSSIFKKVSFPVAFLFFMIPLPQVVIVNMSFQLKMFAAHFATILLNKMRIPAIQEGSIIKMRSAYVIVDDVCSGLRSLISLAALGSVFAYWLKGPWFKRVLLFLTTIPIAIITNVCRVILLSAISEIWGPKYASGIIHDISGFLVFASAFVLLYAVGKIIE